jgi:large subunit ribosomal protein L30
MALKLKVTLIRSGINRPQDQKDTIRGLGLTRMHKTVELNDTAAIRGMIRKVSHLVKVEPVA